MRGILILCAVILIVAAGYIAWRMTRPEHYGRAFVGTEAVAIGEITAEPSTAPTQQDVRVEGVLTRQCPVSGCWFFLRDEADQEIRVDMGPVTPHLPQRIGRKAVVEGRVVLQDGTAEIVGQAVEFK